MKPLICSLLLSLAPLCALAGNYPEKPIRLVVGFPQGGGVDLVARQFSGHLAKALGQPVNVENVLGEAGNKASREVAAAAPDGYTVMIVNPANIAINPSLYPNLGFDPQNAFAPVARMVVTPLMALIPASLSPQNMDEFITRLRTQKSLKYTSGGVGNINQLAVELFKIKSNTKLTHVPAKNSAAALVELIEGRAQMMTDGGHVAGGTYPRRAHPRARSLCREAPGFAAGSAHRRGGWSARPGGIELAWPRGASRDAGAGRHAPARGRGRGARATGVFRGTHQPGHPAGAARRRRVPRVYPGRAGALGRRGENIRREAGISVPTNPQAGRLSLINRAFILHPHSQPLPL
jgi:hypothetical protein